MADNDIDINDSLISRAEALKNSLSEIRRETRITNAALRELEKAGADYGGTFRSITSGASKVSEIQRKALQHQRGINQAIDAQEKQQDNVAKLNAQINTLYEQALNSTTEGRDVLLQQARNLSEARENAQELVNIYKEVVKQAEILNSKTRFFDRTAELIKALPGLGPLLSIPFEKAAEKAREVAKEGKGLLTTYGEGFLTLGKSLVGLLSLGTIVKTLIDSTKQTKELSLALGVSQKQANQLQRELTTFADNTYDSRITTQGLVEAQIKLQQNLKLGTQFSGETLSNFIKLTQYMGVTEQAASKIALIQESLQDSSNKFQSTLAQSVTETGALVGINIPLQEVFEEIGKLSAETLLSLRRNPQAIGQAIVEAKKLGIELKDVLSISQSLLNFEQSIQSELEAEVLTGRQLNLEQARIAAILGDQLTLTKEIASQVGTITEFENMNVIQRESLAKAFGMNISQMSELLLRQEALNVLGEKGAKLSADQLKAAQLKVTATKDLATALLEVQQEASVTQNFENAAKQLQQAFQSIVVQITPLITEVSKMLAQFFAHPVSKIVTLIGGSIGIVLKALTSIRGFSPAFPVYTKEAGIGPGTGSGMFYTSGQGLKYNRSGRLYDPSTGRIVGKEAAQRAGLTTMGRTGTTAGGLTTVGRLAVGAGAGMAGMLAGGALSSAAESASTEGTALGLSTAGSALSMAGTGAMIGAIGGPIGMAVGAGIGAVVGGITGYMERAEKQRQEAESKKNDELKAALREVAMKEARIYMNSVEVGRQIVNESFKVS